MLPEKPVTGDAIVVCGQRVCIGAPVVLWNEAPHYDGYGSIIVDLKKISREALRELIVRAWTLKATPKLRAQAQGPSGAPVARSARHRRTRR